MWQKFKEIFGTPLHFLHVIFKIQAKKKEYTVTNFSNKRARKAEMQKKEAKKVGLTVGVNFEYFFF